MYHIDYDGSFDGLLSAVFWIYQHKIPLAQCQLGFECSTSDLFAQQQHVATHLPHAQRVFERLQRRLGQSGMRRLLFGFLSQHNDMPNVFLRIVDKILHAESGKNPLLDYTDLDIVQWAQWEKAVSHERHFVTAFVRFEALQNGLWLAQIEPKYDVLPLAAPHFQKRYPEMPWAIYDVQRGYGIFCQDKKTHIIHELDLNQPEAQLSEHEKRYQQLWQQYFASTNIESRRNMHLQRKQMPERYWRYLTEKQAKID